MLLQEMPSVGCPGARVSGSKSALVGKEQTVGSKMDCLELAPGLSLRVLLSGTNSPLRLSVHNGKCLTEKTAACMLKQHARGEGSFLQPNPITCLTSPLGALHDTEQSDQGLSLPDSSTSVIGSPCSVFPRHALTLHLSGPQGQSVEVVTMTCTQRCEGRLHSAKPDLFPTP